MTTKICAVYDRAVQAYGQPIFVRATGEAIRSFIDETNNKESALGKHPEDYDLYLLGEFDDQNGAITSEIKTLMNGQDLKRNPIE